MGLPTSLPGPVPQAQSPSIPIYSASPLVTFGTRQVSPPSQVYVGLEDVIHVALWNSLAGAEVDVTTRLLRADGQVITNTQTLLPTSNRVRNDYYLQLAEGFILSIAVTTPTVGLLRGMCWANVHIATGNNQAASDTQPLISDYIASSQTSGWPGGRQISSIEGPGVLYNAAIANPGAGMQVNVQPPVNARWRIIGMNTNLITSVAVANRRVLVVYNGAPGSGLQAQAFSTQAASLTYSYWLSDYGFQPTDTPASAVFVVLPSGLVTARNYYASITASALQAADQFINTLVSVEEWLEPTS